MTIGYCNAFNKRFKEVALITGSIHGQGETLDRDVEVIHINRWAERPAWKKFNSYIMASMRIYWHLLTRFRGYEVLFISLPPMAYLLNVLLPHRSSMLLWDVYPDILKITGMSENHIIYRIWSGLNRLSFSKSYKLFTIGKKMTDLLGQYTAKEKIKVQPIWSIFQKNEKTKQTENPFIQKYNLQDKFIVQYSGNIGLTHNVEVMIDLAELLQDNENIHFQIIGRGPRMPYLKSLVNEKNLPNCQFLPFQSDEMFPYSLSAADIGIVILDERISKGSVPSKSYNLMSFGIPSLYIASEESELYSYAEKYKHGRCFKHSELKNAADFIKALYVNSEIYEQYSQNALKASQNFRRENADKLVESYLAADKD